MLEEQLKEDPERLLQEMEQKLAQAQSVEEKTEFLQIKTACLSEMKRKDECFACLLELLELGLELKDNEILSLYKTLADRLLNNDDTRPDDMALIQRWEEFSLRLPEILPMDSVEAKSDEEDELDQQLKDDPEGLLDSIELQLEQAESPEDRLKLLQYKLQCLASLDRMRECFACALDFLELALELKIDALIDFSRNLAEQWFADEDVISADDPLRKRWQELCSQLPEPEAEPTDDDSMEGLPNNKDELEQRLAEDPEGFLKDVEERLTQPKSSEDTVYLLQYKLHCLTTLERNLECVTCMLDILELGIALENDDVIDHFSDIAKTNFADEELISADDPLRERWQEICSNLSEMDSDDVEGKPTNAEDQQDCSDNELRDIDLKISSAKTPEDKFIHLRRKLRILVPLNRKNVYFDCVLDFIELGLELKKDEMVDQLKDRVEQLLSDEDTRPSDESSIQRWEVIRSNLVS